MNIMHSFPHQSIDAAPRRLPRARFPGAAALIAAVALAWAAPADAQPRVGDADAWRFTLVPYVWLPTLNAQLTYPLPGIAGGGGGGDGGSGAGGIVDGAIDTEIGPNRYLTHLEFALMLTGEARRGPWSILADYIGMRVSGEGSSLRAVSIGGSLLPDEALGAVLDVGTVSTIKVALWNVVVGHALGRNEASQIDAIAGLRFGRLESRVDWRLSASVSASDESVALQRSGSAQATRTPVDAVIGLRGRYRLDERWSIPYYVDIGAGSSTLTWQAFAGASYAFGWGDILVAYRHLSLQDERRDVFRKLTLSGPSIGATFRF